MVVSEQHGNPVGQTTNPADPCQISRACESSIFQAPKLMSGPASWFNNLSTCDFSFGPPPIHACSLSQETSHSSGTSNIGCLLQPRLHLTALASFRHYSLVHIAWLQWPLKIIVQSSMSTICILLLAEDLVWLPSITQIVDSVYFDMENLKNTSLGSCFYEGNLFNCIIISGSLFSNEFLF